MRRKHVPKPDGEPKHIAQSAAIHYFIKNPDRFDPDLGEWVNLEGLSKLSERYDFIVGKEEAQEMKLVISGILSNFALALADSRSVRPVRRGLTAGPSPFRMVVKEHRPSGSGPRT